jgi:integrase/recombinase XerD
MEKNSLAKYKLYLKSKNLKPQTIKNYSWHVGKFLLWSDNKSARGGPASGGKITTPLLKKYKEFLLAKQKNIGSINLRLVILNSYLHFSGIKYSFELLTDHKNRLAALTPLQLQNFLDQPLKKNNPVGHRDKALLEILYTSGLKVSDLVNLKKNQVDFLSREIIFTSTGPSTMSSGPNGSGRATKKHIALPPYALHYLEKYLNFRRDKSLWLFVNFDRSKKAGEKALSVRSVERMVEKYALALRPRLKITPQILRNTLAYNLKSQGVKDSGLKEALHFKTKVAAGNYLNRL